MLKIERVSEHIWSIKTWLLIPIRVWVVVSEDGVTLVDGGMPFMAKGIMKFIDSLNAGPLRRIVLTHGHSDHVGAIHKIVDSQGTDAISVYAHRIEIPYMEGQIPYPRRKKVEHNLRAGLAQPLSDDATGALHPIAGLQPYLTPGHSPGHIVYYHEQDQVLLAGDLFTSRSGKLRRPMLMFTADMAEAVKSSRIVSELNPKRLEVCHGGPVLEPSWQIESYMQGVSLLKGNV
ncbi:MBL fold metallo-hydrolase [Paenibacillus sp. 481]|uniref:MBL fold metallo-hydrolase n=1 Tax=Paenibacillus sp. 481 TaxID=2835869 RepID=UPI001E44FEF6|nr:MBL fold metallo-hydrolase [Paenibacillus sp. 481]UHA72217.1 MBL fold metallo-hydrolase [Paenibacillus sp. 481]